MCGSGFEVKVIAPETYVKRDSGLIYWDIEVGNGDCPKDGQQVLFYNYNIFSSIFLQNQDLSFSVVVQSAPILWNEVLAFLLSLNFGICHMFLSSDDIKG